MSSPIHFTMHQIFAIISPAASLVSCKPQKYMVAAKWCLPIQLVLNVLLLIIKVSCVVEYNGTLILYM